ncbi:MAG: hypothetical protein QOC79_2551 [Actinomycetota bacterium]|nr:hypothetical protein [Actinomycetota bacterium]
MTDIRELLHSATPLAEDLDVDSLRRAAGRRRVRRFAVTTIAVVVVAASAAVVLTAGRPAGRRHVVVQGSSTTAVSTSTVPIFGTASTGVDLLPAAPLARRDGAAVVWTGTSLAVWGGNFDAPNSGVAGPYRSYKDGAVYDPATRQWTPMAASPLPIGEQAAGARTDDGVVFTQGRATAMWDPATNRWRRLDDAPAPALDLTYTGSLVVSYSANATLDPRSGTWRPLPSVPVQLARSTLAWTGHELVVIGGPGDPFRSANAIALDPERREWRRLPDPPPAVHAEALAATWDGRRVVVVNYDMRAIAYDPGSDTWSTLPNMPARFSEHLPTAGSVGGYTAVLMSGAVVVLTPSDLWVPLPYGQIPYGNVGSTRPSPDSAGGDLFVTGVRNRESNGIAIVDLARMVATASRLQVGIGSVLPPPGYRLLTSHFDGLPSNERVRIELNGPNEATCSVDSTYSYVTPPPTGSLVHVTLQNDGEPKGWYRNASGTQWNTDATGTDSLSVECSDPTTARQLAESASFKNTS